MKTRHLIRYAERMQEFIRGQQGSGVLILLATVCSLCLANSAWSAAYLACWQHEFFPHISAQIVINDALMVVFFFHVGLEIKRELVAGDLRKFKTASLPVVAALGGMIVPAFIFLCFNKGEITLSGWGIPMATDIAFALSIMSALGRRVPLSLKMLLTTLAVVDDLGAVIVIAVFYTKQLQWWYILAALGLWILLWLLNYLRVKHWLPFVLLGIVLWLCVLLSGVHATIAGVLLAFTIPYAPNEDDNLLDAMAHQLHFPVSYFVLPLFALCNTPVSLFAGWQQALFQPLSLGIISGLVAGKTIGIAAFSWLAVRMRISYLPADISWQHILGMAMLGGIGFTMSIFITDLAFADALLIERAKLSVLLASLMAAMMGAFFLLTVPVKE